MTGGRRWRPASAPASLQEYWLLELPRRDAVVARDVLA
jgi:hypothetical protein